MALEVEKRHKEIFQVKTEIEILDAKIESYDKINEINGNSGQSGLMASLKEKIRDAELKTKDLESLIWDQNNLFDLKYKEAKATVEKQINENLKITINKNHFEMKALSK